MAVVEEVSRYDASVGWNLAIGAETSAIWAFLPESTARPMREAFGDVPIAGSANPSRARAVPVPGGYRVTGRWSFASGVHQAGWFLGAALVWEGPDDTGGPRLVNGEPDVRFFVMCIEACEIEDTWHVTGLRGTGSCDVVAHDVFAPEGRQFNPIGPEPTEAFQPGALYSAPLLRTLGFPLAAVGLGLARDAIDSFRELAKAKTPQGSSTALERWHSVHLRIGQAEAILRSGRELLYSVARQTDAALRAGAGVDDDLFVSAMLARAQAVESAAQAVDLVLDCAGTSSIFEGSRLERCSRDIRMVPRHIYTASSNFEMAGQYLLGGPLQLRR